MKKFLMMVAVASLIATNVFAQSPFRIGAIAGLELSNMRVKIGDESDSGDLKAGFKVGILGEYSFNENFAIEPGLIFAQRGNKVDESFAGESYKETVTLNYMQIPINLKASYPINEEVKLFALAGPYFGIALSGNLSLEMTAEDGMYKGDGDIEFGSNEGEMKRFDFGLSFGAGIEFRGAFLRAQYDLGVSNLTNVSDNKVSNRNIGISVGYMF